MSCNNVLSCKAPDVLIIITELFLANIISIQIAAYKIYMYVARKRPTFYVYLIVNVNLHVHSTMKFVYMILLQN